jgi:acylphosphatase
MIRVHLKIHGRVQGVYFRAHAIQKAEALGGITGFVANDSDGTVVIVAEGPENKINDFTDWCHSGPSTAEVEKVEAERADYSGEFDGFNIRY